MKQEIKLQAQLSNSISQNEVSQTVMNKITETPFLIFKPSFIKSAYFTRAGHWTNFQKAKYTVFIQFHQQKFVKREQRRMFKIFKAMSQFIKTRNPNQCRSHHQKMQRDFLSIEAILSNSWVQVSQSRKIKILERYQRQLSAQQKLMKIDQSQIQYRQNILFETKMKEQQPRKTAENNMEIKEIFIKQEQIGRQSEQKDRKIPRTDTSIKAIQGEIEHSRTKVIQQQKFYQQNAPFVINFCNGLITPSYILPRMNPGFNNNFAPISDQQSQGFHLNYQHNFLNNIPQFPQMNGLDYKQENRLMRIHLNELELHKKELIVNCSQYWVRWVKSAIELQQVCTKEKQLQYKMRPQ